MAKSLADLRVCIFDVFGTVVDWRGSLIEDLPKLGREYGLDTDWTSFADDWRGLYQPQMHRVRKGELPWTNIDELHKEAFEILLKKRGLSTGVGDEGGFAPNLKSNLEALEIVLEAVEKAGFKAGGDVYIALDVASSELWNDENKNYEFKKSKDRTRSADDMVRLYEDWVRQYPIISIEDGLAEGDWDGWKTLTKALGGRVQLVGDDVFVTNPEILKRGISEKIANALKLGDFKWKQKPKQVTLGPDKIPAMLGGGHAIGADGKGGKRAYALIRGTPNILAIVGVDDDAPQADMEMALASVAYVKTKK